MIEPEYEFLFADVGMSSKISGGGIWSQNPYQILHHSLIAQTQYHMYVQEMMLFLSLHS